jgi:hypothetical protein
MAIKYLIVNSPKQIAKMLTDKTAVIFESKPGRVLIYVPAKLFGTISMPFKKIMTQSCYYETVYLADAKAFVTDITES